MLKVTDEMLTGMEEIFKTQLQASDVWWSKPCKHGLTWDTNHPIWQVSMP